MTKIMEFSIFFDDASVKPPCYFSKQKTLSKYSTTRTTSWLFPKLVLHCRTKLAAKMIIIIFTCNTVIIIFIIIIMIAVFVIIVLLVIIKTIFGTLMSIFNIIAIQWT